MSMELLFYDYEEKVRTGLDLSGLPRNWQPDRTSIKPFHAGGYSVEHCVKWFARDVQRYETHINSGETL